MPLSAPVEREHLHTRKVECRGFRRNDGLWDIEGHMTDVKSYSFSNEHRGRVDPGDPLHDMWLRITLDDALTIMAVEAVTEKAPYSFCPDITPNFQKLIGLRIKGGFTRMVRVRLGGVHGCTHLVELLGPMATTAFQTIYPILSKERAARRLDGSGNDTETANEAAQAGEAAGEVKAGEVKAGEAEKAREKRRPPPLLNSCHAYASDGPLVKRMWPEFYTGPGSDRSEAGN